MVNENILLMGRLLLLMRRINPELILERLRTSQMIIALFAQTD